METTEELFDLRKNRLEMKNVISENSKVLKIMKGYYNDELKAIKENVFIGHGYEKYAEIFDQNVDIDALTNCGQLEQIDGDW